MRNIEGVARSKQAGSPYSVGFGFIVIPPGIDRDAFVETCYRKEKVTIATDNGAVINECYVTSDTLQKISFPQKVKERGSSIVFVSCEFQTKPIVVGCIGSDDSSTLLSEGMYRVRKRLNGTEVLIQLDPKTNSIVVGLTSKAGTEGKVFITSRGSEKCEINLESSGVVKVKADKEIEATSYKEVSSKVVDVRQGKQEDLYSILMNLEEFSIIRKNEEEEAFLKIVPNEISLSWDKGNEIMTLSKNLIQLTTSKELKINGGREPITLAETLIQKMEMVQTNIDLLVQAFQAGSTAAIPTPGPASDQGKAAFSAAAGVASGVQKVDFSTIKSEVSFTD